MYLFAGIMLVLVSNVRARNETNICPDIENFEHAFKIVQRISDLESKQNLTDDRLDRYGDWFSASAEQVSGLLEDLKEANYKIEKLAEKVAELESHPECETSPTSGQDTFVGFTAYLSSNAWNLPIGEPVILQKTLVNAGEGYNTATGKFTAPVSGYYSFTVVIESKNYGSCVIRMVVDGQNTLDVVVEPYHSEQNLHGVNAGVVSLDAGQQVWIEPYQVNTPFLEGTDYYRFTTFSGVLLHRH